MCLFVYHALIHSFFMLLALRCSHVTVVLFTVDASGHQNQSYSIVRDSPTKMPVATLPAEEVSLNG